MSAEVTNLSKEKINQLLAAVGSKPLADTTNIETKEYNWNQPHYFDLNQLNRIDEFTKRVSRAMSIRFADFCQSDSDFNVISTTQHFAAEFVEQAMESGQNDYYLAFGADLKNPCGVISIPTQTALRWATQLLGDIDSTVEEENTGRYMTQLEESLLADLLSALIEAFSQKYWDFKTSKNLVRRLIPLELKGTEELCKINFEVKKVNQDKGDEAYILILCNELQPVAGRAEQTFVGFSADDISKAILARMQQMPVFITAQLASLVLTLREIMSLEVGDLLLLDNKVTDPIELIINGQTALLGRPVKSVGKYAILITDVFKGNN